jgi:hypothetical protein
MSSSTNINYNNFFNNYEHAGFIQSIFSRNSWKRNYWDDLPPVGYKTITGQLRGMVEREYWRAFDFQAARQPYII